MTVLFVSEIAHDAHLLPVARELARRGVDVRVFNPGDFPTSASITADATDAGQHVELRCADEAIDLAEVRSVWYRRPGRYELAPGLLPEEAAWVRGECASFVDGVWANTDALWVSAPHHIRRANLKLLQIRLARELGFKVPPTRITNDPARARAFIDAHPEGVVVKALGIPTLTIDGKGAGMVYTHRVNSEDLDYLDSVRHGPTFLQAFVRKQRDIRVTVIGDEVFAAGIESGQVAGARDDFRLVDAMDIPHVPLSLPTPLETACRALVRQLGLNFGAIDLLHTPDGEYVFLEINPNGQWLWIEMVTDIPLTRAMADLLERGLHGQSTTPAPRSAPTPRTLQVGEQTIPVPTALSTRLTLENGHPALDLAATRAWFERQKQSLRLHVGDIDADEPEGR